MKSVVADFVSQHAVALLVAGALIVMAGLNQWRRIRVVELELEFKQGLLDQGLSVTEIERLLAARPAPRKGLLEQFGALSGGAKAGVIIALIIISTVTTSALVGAVQSYAFWSRIPPPPQSLGRP